MSHEPDEGWLARAGEWMADHPSGDTDEVEGGCGEHVLAVDLHQSNGPGAAQIQVHTPCGSVASMPARTVLGDYRGH